MKPLGSLNLQGFFVFRIVQFSRYQFVIFIDPLHSAAFLLYHIAYRLSRGFLNFFKVFCAPDSWYRSPLEAAYLAYHISFGLSSTFFKISFSLVGLSRFSGSLGDLFILPHLPPFVNTRMLQIHSIYLAHFYAYHPKRERAHPTNRRMRFSFIRLIP